MSESTEMYLKTIFLLERDCGFVKAIMIANKLNISKPSVSNAISSLKEKGYIEIDGNLSIRLTNLGYQIAHDIYNRFLIIIDYLMNNLNLSEEEAHKNACKMEHIITDSCLIQMKFNIKEEIMC